MFESHFTRRGFSARLGAAVAGLFASEASSAPLKEIPTARSLQAEISIALKTGSPLLVFVSLDNCPFCKIARENYLLSLLNAQSATIVQVSFRHSVLVIDAHGNSMSQDQLIRTWGVKVAPTVLFLGKDGREVAPRLAGGSTSDFYGAYLDERIRFAQAAIAKS